MSYLPYALSAWLFLVGLYGLVTSRHYVHLIVCLSIMQASTYVLLLAIGFRKAATAPIFKDVSVGTKAVDPIVQSLTLTDIVVSVTMSALLLALVIQVHRRTGSVDPDRLRPLKG